MSGRNRIGSWRQWLRCAPLLIMAGWVGCEPSPSGQTIPLGDLPGWHQVFADDFNSNIGLGSFSGCSDRARRCDGLLGTSEYDKLWAYPDGWPDTSGNGHYTPSRTISEHDGVLDLWIHTEGGTHMVSAPVPILPGAIGSEGGLQYGRYVIRFRSDSMHGYKTSWLLWPDSEVWPRDGEINFPEGNLDGTIRGFVHHQDGTSPNDQTGFGWNVTYTHWHTAVIEWMPGRVKFILDGARQGTSIRVPDTPMHWVIQTESNTDGYSPDPNVQGHVYIDWVAVYTPA